MPRSKIHSFCPVWLFGVLVGSVLITGCGPETGVSSDGSPSVGILPNHYSDVAPTPPPPGTSSHWDAYQTQVNPGGPIAFASEDFGLRVDGQGGAPYLDASLAAGPEGTNFTWPGSSVSLTTDGGNDWKTVLTDGNGIWGIDMVSVDTSWAVGVESLYRTIDGGLTWKAVGEPYGQTLVTVEFVTDVDGFGLTTDGSLVETVDGGASWDSTGGAGGATALCFTSATIGYKADQAGDVLSTVDGGKSWSLAVKEPFPGDIPVWAGISCEGDDALVSFRGLDLRSHFSIPYLVIRTGDRGRSWSVISTSSPRDKSLGLPEGPSLFGALGAATLGTLSTAIIAGFPATGWSVRLDVIDFSDGTVSHTNITSLSAGETIMPSSSAYLEVHGAAAFGDSAWLYLNNNAAGAPNAPETQTVLLHTTDRGKTWSVEAGQPANPPPLDN
jgi:photosystem II stability/assembly factor-like uncharacterized protein